MSERRLLALLALLLGLLGALLVLLGIRLPNQGQDFLVWLASVGARGILALAAAVGSLLIYGSAYRTGGIVNLVVGIALIIFDATTGGLLVIFSGILGLVAAGTFDEYRRRR